MNALLVYPADPQLLGERCPDVEGCSRDRSNGVQSSGSDFVAANEENMHEHLVQRMEGTLVEILAGIEQGTRSLRSGRARLPQAHTQANLWSGVDA